MYTLLLFKQNTIFSKFILETPAIIKGECYQNKLPKLTRHTYILEQPFDYSTAGCLREWKEIFTDGLLQAHFL